MKKLLFLCLFLSFTVGADTLESHINNSVKPLGKLLEGKKGKVVIGSFKNAKSSTCAPNKGLASKLSAALTRSGIKTSLASRAVSVDSDQNEISRVTKLSGGSYIILGTYELSGKSFKLDCTVYDHNGAGVGACDDLAAVAISAEVAETMACEATAVAAPTPVKEVVKEAPKAEVAAVKEEIKTGSKTEQIDNYICENIYAGIRVKTFFTGLYQSKLLSIEDFKAVKRGDSTDALGVKKDNCMTLGNFIICTTYSLPNNLAEVLGDTYSNSDSIYYWKHPNKSQVKNASKCLMKENNWWNSIDKNNQQL